MCCQVPAPGGRVVACLGLNHRGAGDTGPSRRGHQASPQALQRTGPGPHDDPARRRGYQASPQALQRQPRCGPGHRSRVGDTKPPRRHCNLPVLRRTLSTASRGYQASPQALQQRSCRSACIPGLSAGFRAPLGRRYLRPSRPQCLSRIQRARRRLPCGFRVPPRRSRVTGPLEGRGTRQHALILYHAVRCAGVFALPGIAGAGCGLR